MKCPECGNSSKVVDSREVDDKRIRFRRCKVCKKYFYTLEAHVPYKTGEIFMKRYGKISRDSRRVKDEQVQSQELSDTV